MIKYTTFRTKLGEFGLVKNDIGLQALLLPQPKITRRIVRKYGGQRKDVEFRDLIHRLKHYLVGEFITFDDIQVNTPNATQFQKMVWSAIRKVPWGQVRSYNYIAQLINKPSAARAVGNALATNPAPIIIPCHRIIGSDGKLRGFIAGLKFKKILLDIERRGLKSLMKKEGDVK